MTLIADTGPLYALYDADDEHHEAVRAVVELEPGAIVVPVAVLPELDFLLLENLGVEAELAFLADLAAGAFSLDAKALDDLPRIRELIAQYENLELGYVDAAVITTAERLGIERVLTVDLRDFRAVRAQTAKPLVLLPADA